MNAREERVANSFKAHGNTVLSTGWPDLLIFNGRGGFALELKGKGDGLSEAQKEMHRALGLFGVPVFTARYSELYPQFSERIVATGFGFQRWGRPWDLET